MMCTMMFHVVYDALVFVCVLYVFVCLCKIVCIPSFMCCSTACMLFLFCEAFVTFVVGVYDCVVLCMRSVHVLQCVFTCLLHVLWFVCSCIVWFVFCSCWTVPLCISVSSYRSSSRVHNSIYKGLHMDSCIEVNDLRPMNWGILRWILFISLWDYCNYCHHYGHYNPHIS